MDTRETTEIVKGLEQRLFLRDALNRIERNVTVQLSDVSQESAGVVALLGAHGSESFQWNCDRDVRFARQDARFDHVAHVFHMEWFGMRSAAGALPGHKLAISSQRMLNTDAIQEILKALSDAAVTAVVFHGFSRHMALLVQALAAAGLGNTGLVWHGAPGMWVWEEERTLFFLAKDLLDRGVLRRMHGMRSGTEELIGKRAWIPQLLNVPPVYAGRKSLRAPRTKAVFCPSWNLVHKNLFSNIAAAVVSARVNKVYTLADNLQLPSDMARKLVRLPKLDQVQMLQIMSACDAVMNVSLVDCHPMVEMEALAARTPALRGPLFLDVLEDHPYVEMTQVENPLSVRDIRSKLEGLLDVSRREMAETMGDYAAKLTEIALDRYLEFTEFRS